MADETCNHPPRFLAVCDPMWGYGSRLVACRWTAYELGGNGGTHGTVATFLPEGDRLVPTEEYPEREGTLRYGMMGTRKRRPDGSALDWVMDHRRAVAARTEDHQAAQEFLSRAVPGAEGGTRIGASLIMPASPGLAALDQQIRDAEVVLALLQAQARTAGMMIGFDEPDGAGRRVDVEPPALPPAPLDAGTLLRVAAFLRSSGADRLAEEITGGALENPSTDPTPGDVVSAPKPR